MTLRPLSGPPQAPGAIGGGGDLRTADGPRGTLKVGTVLAMDYNLFVRHSGGFERTDYDGTFEERAFRAFMDAFEAEHGGSRTPLPDRPPLHPDEWAAPTGTRSSVSRAAVCHSVTTSIA